MEPARRISVGDYDACWVRDTDFAIDAGTMFNTVPRVLWQRKIAMDDQHRMRIGLNCLLLRGEGHTVLVDAGIGDKLPEKQKRIYGLDSGRSLIDSLREAGVGCEQIDYVVLTHLHLAHAGWATRFDSRGRLTCTFPNARFVVQQAEWDAAHAPSELTEGSYRGEDFDLLAAEGRLMLVEGECRVTPSIRTRLTGGHSPGHQIVRIDSGGQTLICPSEMLPTSWHMRLAWLMSYDLDTPRVLEAKRAIMEEAAARGQVLFLNHDPVTAFGRLRAAGRTEYAWEPVMT